MLAERVLFQGQPEGRDLAGVYLWDTDQRCEARNPGEGRVGEERRGDIVIALHSAYDFSSLKLSGLPRVSLSVKFINVQFAPSSSSLITMSNKNSLNNAAYGDFLF